MLSKTDRSGGPVVRPDRRPPPTEGKKPFGAAGKPSGPVGYPYRVPEPPPINPQQQKGTLLFNAACTYAVVARHVRLNKQGDPGYEKSIQKLTQRVIDLLRLAQAQDRLGPKELATALADDALDSIRETNEFQSFQKQLTGAIEK